MAKPNNIVFDDPLQCIRRDCDDDFVFVEKDFEPITTGDDYGDDADSYDYCEDVCCIISDGNAEEKNNDDIYLSSEGIDNENTSQFTGLKDLALSVPLVLLKDLDEAHEAAKLTRINHLDGVTDLITTCSDDEYVFDADERNILSSPSPNNFVLGKTGDGKADKLENSSLSISSTLDKYNDDRASIGDSSPTLSNKSNKTSCTSASNGDFGSKNSAIIPMSVTTNGEKSASNEIPATSPCFLLASAKFNQNDKNDKDEKKSLSEKNGGDTNAANRTSSVQVSMSRASNKKRRKRLKLLKKAQAAEKFQQQAAFASLSSLKGKHSKKITKQQKNKSSRSNSRKSTNIAVSCAIDSISSYRKELYCQQGKQ